MEAFEELKVQVVDALRSKGVLGSIKAEIRASVYSILQEEEKDKGVHRANPVIREVIESQKGVLLLSLIADSLKALNLNYTLDCFLAESTLDTNQVIDSPGLSQRLGVEHTPNQPILAQLLTPQARSTAPQLNQQAPAASEEQNSTSQGQTSTGDLETAMIDKQLTALLNKQLGGSFPGQTTETKTQNEETAKSTSAPPPPSVPSSTVDSLPPGASLVKDSSSATPAASTSTSSVSVSSPSATSPLSSSTPAPAEPPAPPASNMASSSASTPTTSANTLSSLPPAKGRLSGLSDLPPLGRKQLSPLSSAPPLTKEAAEEPGAESNDSEEGGRDMHLQQLEQRLADMEAKHPELKQVRSAYESGNLKDEEDEEDDYDDEFESIEEEVEEDLGDENGEEDLALSTGSDSQSPRGDLEGSFEDSVVESKVDKLAADNPLFEDMQLDYVEKI